ncbi:PREDICTED: uncharacterized protein LOC107335157 [Acropora digitifera]|uniref:uncharacterized protein LOC107335157 n=1 Tax=Acropora digitifera TaxID=70779 RepID=UPI00077ADBC5|nr:PREDICTED: uncharacterized protein LOC107335157 [Acropora digitifera]
MSSGEKKGGKGKAPSRPKPPKAQLNDQRFRGEGVKFKCKLVGSLDVTSAKGDAICADAIKKLKTEGKAGKNATYVSKRKLRSFSLNTSPNSTNPQNSDSNGVYEVPYKNDNYRQAQSSFSDVYSEAAPPSEGENEQQYQVPNKSGPPLHTTPLSQRVDNQGDEGKNYKTSPHQSHLQPYYEEPDQVSQTSVPDSSSSIQDNSTTDVAFFSSSVFDTAPGESGIGDTVSVASSADISVLRSDSVSSESSETWSRNSRSNSFIHQTVEGTQPRFSATLVDSPGIGMSKTATSDHDQLEYNGRYKDEQRGMSNPDPLAGTSDPFASRNEDERTAADLGGFSMEPFAAFDSAFGDRPRDSIVKDNFIPSGDPFAPSSDDVSTSESAEGFTSETSFEVAFSSEPFSTSQPNTATIPYDNQKERDEIKNKTETRHDESAVVSFLWDNSFAEPEEGYEPNPEKKTDEDSSTSYVGTTSKSETQHIATQEDVSSNNPPFSWEESFNSDEMDVTAKSVPTTSVSWVDAFGAAPQESTESSHQAFDSFSWDDAFCEKTPNTTGSPFDSSSFDDTFGSSSKDESSKEKTVLRDPDTQQVLEKPVSDSDFVALASSQAEGSDAEDETATKKFAAATTDPFDEFRTEFGTPAPKTEIIAPEKSSNSHDSDAINIGEVSTLNNNLSSVQNANDRNEFEQNDEIVSDTEDQQFESTAKNSTLEREEEEEEVKEERPAGLQIQESILSVRPQSPTAPPPLPPRPLVSAPPLPMRPSGSKSTTSPAKSPLISELSVESPPTDSPNQGKKSSAKKTPPPPPPRVDLNEKPGVISSNQQDDFPDPFGSDAFENKFGNKNDVGHSEWTTSWPNVSEVSPKEQSKDKSDPFSDSFFTDFHFGQKYESSKEINDNPDPFGTSNSSSEPFPVGFQSEDLFAVFTPAKVDVVFREGGPFQNDSFSALPSSDPFCDITDPFADKGVLNDNLFGDSPSNPHTGESLTLNESLNASDEADSFA